MTATAQIADVPWNYLCAAAQRSVVELFGVTGVDDNRIVLRPLIPASPAEAHRNITAALVRNVTLGADEVVVSVAMKNVARKNVARKSAAVQAA